MRHRKLRRTSEERRWRIGARMAAGTGDGHFDVASPARKFADPRITQRRGEGCIPEEFTWFEPGVLGTWSSKDRWYPPFDGTLVSVRASVDTVPTGAPIKVDVNKNGTTVFTTQANRPTIAAAGHTALDGGINTVDFVVGDYFTFDLDQVGSTIPGSDLAVTLGYLVCNRIAGPAVAPQGCELPALPGGTDFFSDDFSSGDTSGFDLGTGGWVGNHISDPAHFPAGLAPLPCDLVNAYTPVNQYGEGFSGAFNVPGSVKEMYLQCRFFIQSSGLALAMGDFIYFGFAGTDVFAIKLDASAKVQAVSHESGGHVVETAPSPLPLDQWHDLLIHIKFDATGGICDASVDGTAGPYGFTFAGLTIANGAWVIDYVQFVNPQTSQQIFFTDISASTVP